MFTGLVEEVGRIVSITRNTVSAVLSIQASKIMEDIGLGDSIAVNGVCLTVTTIKHNCFFTDVMHETLRRSALGNLRIGSAVNLERAMGADGRFGGHIVNGHIDGTGIIADIHRDDNAIWFRIRSSPQIMHYVIEKGSIAMDGISLTVASVDRESFSISAIPHTVSNTTLTQRKIGDVVNLENDCIGKYVEKFVRNGSNITSAFLNENGF